MRLTRRTLLEVYRRASAARQRAAMDNPQEFAAAAVQIIKTKIAAHLVDGIKYEKDGTVWDLTLQEEIEAWQDNIIPAGSALYDHVVYDSEVERRFVEGMESDKRIRLYVKLPGWFTVDTPIGKYHPDWAIVMDDVDEHGDPKPGNPRLYLVRQTKVENWRTDAPLAAERRKIKCGERHFGDALGVSYRVASKASELPCPPSPLSRSAMPQLHQDRAR